MKIDEIKEGMVVTSICKVYGGIHEILEGTPGIVSAINRYDDVYVRFEVGNNSVTDPILCHPIYLERA